MIYYAHYKTPPAKRPPEGAGRERRDLQGSSGPGIVRRRGRVGERCSLTNEVPFCQGDGGPGRLLWLSLWLPCDRITGKSEVTEDLLAKASVQ
jgi:hypothetical protein